MPAAFSRAKLIKVKPGQAAKGVDSLQIQPLKCFPERNTTNSSKQEHTASKKEVMAELSYQIIFLLLPSIVRY